MEEMIKEIKDDIKEIKDTVTETRIKVAVIEERCKIRCEQNQSVSGIMKSILALLGIGLGK